MSINTIFVEGHVGRDPVLRYTPNKTAVLTFSLAWSDYRDGKAGPTSWFDVTAFGGYASLLEGKIKKGQHLLVTGRCEVRAWDAKDGSKKQQTQIVAESVKLLARPEKSTDAYAQPSMPVGSMTEDQIPF